MALGVPPDDAVVVQQFIRRLGRAVALQIGGRGDDQAPVLDEAVNDQRGIRQAAVKDADVGTGVDDVHLAVGQEQFDLDTRMALEEFREQRRDLVVAEGDHRDDAQRPAQFGLGLRDGRLGLLDLLDDGTAAAVVVLALDGQVELPGGAVEQPHAEPFLQPRDQLAHRRRGQVHGPPGRRESAFLDHRDENGHFPRSFHTGLL